MRGLKQSKFLDNIDLEGLIDFKLTPPFIPEVENYDTMLSNLSSKIEVILQNNSLTDEESINEQEEDSEENLEDYDVNWADGF